MKSYNEDVTIKIYDEELDTILKKSIGELVPEMVAAQINIDSDFEALKVQSIIARTILVRKARAFGGEGCIKHPEADLILDENCKNIISKEKLMDRWGEYFEDNWNKLVKAEKETKYLILTFNNKVIDPKYHISCGGATDNSENVESNKVVYLRKTLCEQCASSPYWNKTKDIRIEDIEKQLGIKFVSISPIEGLDIEGIIKEVKRDEEGRVISLKIGDKVFRGTEVKDKLGLDSTRVEYK